MKSDKEIWEKQLETGEDKFVVKPGPKLKVIKESPLSHKGKRIKKVPVSTDEKKLLERIGALEKETKRLRVMYVNMKHKKDYSTHSVNKKATNEDNS